MPKGSKKRKASKKKAHHHHNPNHHDDATHSSQNNSLAMTGEDNMKQHDDKESDGEDVNSLTSQDNRNSQLDLSDGEKEEREKVDNRPHTSSSSDDNQSVDETIVHPEVVVPTAVNVGGGVDVDQELKLVDQLNGGPLSVVSQHSNEGAYDDVKGDNSTDTVAELVKESGDEYQDKSSYDDVHAIEKTTVSEDDDLLISSYEPVNSLPESLHPPTDAILVKEKSNVIDENGSLLDEKINGDGISSSVPVEIEDANGDKDVILLERNLATAPVDFALEKDGDEVVAKTYIASSDTNLSASSLTEGNFMLPNNGPRSDERNRADSTDDAEQKKDTGISESSVHQPLLAARPERRTSLMNCCGLFGVFSESGR